MVATAPGIKTAADGSGWADGWYWSDDGLRLHWRERAGPDGRPVLLCIPGLTRNCADFQDLGDRLARRWRVIAVDLRGRGDSAWAKDPLSYVAPVYLRDLARLIEAAGLARITVLGSSVGGQLALQLAASDPALVTGVILNDIGPDLAAAGLARLRANVGRGGNWPTWVHAARDFAGRNAAIHPDWQLAQWLAFAKRLCRLAPSGRIVFDHDPRIAEPFRLPHADGGSDLWAALAGLAGKPVLVLRGERSDVLAPATLAAMQARLPGMSVVEVPGVGHPPMLDEPAALAAVDTFLQRIEQEPAS